MVVATSDARVTTLRKQIETKRDAIKSRSSKFIPVTNCSLELDGTRYNLHTLDTIALIFVGAKLQSLIAGADTLFHGANGLIISGYTASDWVIDIKSRIEAVAVRSEEAQLRTLDAKLKELLSSDAKTEMALNEIEALLV